MIQETWVETRDGIQLGVTTYGSEIDGPKAVILINSAAATKQGFYRDFAVRLVEYGHVVATYDYRGIGRSRPKGLRGFKASMSNWAELDFEAMLDWTGARFPRVRRFVVGHSFGGQALGLTEKAADIDGAVLVAAQSGYWGHWPGSEKWRMAFNWYMLLPAVVGVFGYVPGWIGMGEDMPGGVALEWAGWCRNPEYAVGARAPKRQVFERFSRPMLALGFSDDAYAPRAAVEGLLDFFRGADIDRRHIRPEDVGAERIGHFGCFKNPKVAEIVAEWLEKRLASEHRVQGSGFRVQG